MDKEFTKSYAINRIAELTEQLEELKEWNIKVETEHEEMIQEYNKRIVKLEEENRDLHTAINMSIPNQIAMRDELERLHTCIDDRIYELNKQLKELPKQIVEKIKENFYRLDSFSQEDIYYTPSKFVDDLDNLLKEYQGDK